LLVANTASALTESWTDDFANTNLVGYQTNVAIGGGVAKLDPASLVRQGIQLASSSDIISPAIVYTGSEYVLYYAECSPYGTCAIARAVSADANSWNPQGIVVNPGLAGSTDSSSVAYEDVMLVGSTFHMWYSGHGGGAYAIHHASSMDGRNWTPDGVVLSGATDGSGGATYYPSVLWDGSQFTMWYGTYDGQNTWIRRATSVDGISWNPTGIVLSPVADGLDNSGPRTPSVVRTAAGYIMWYTCIATQGQICRATSADGITWTREGLVLAPDPNLSGESRDISQPEVLLWPGPAYRVWYAGRGSAGINQIYGALSPIDQFVVSGSIVSVPISIADGFFWQSLSITKEEPSGTAIRISVLNATTFEPFPGLNGLTSSVVSLEGLSSTRGAIRLAANFTGGGDSTPFLDRWTVTMATAPPQPTEPPRPLSLWEEYSTAIVVSAVLVVAAVGGALLVLLLNRPRRNQPPLGIPPR